MTIKIVGLVSGCILFLSLGFTNTASAQDGTFVLDNHCPLCHQNRNQGPGPDLFTLSVEELQNRMAMPECRGCHTPASGSPDFRPVSSDTSPEPKAAKASSRSSKKEMIYIPEGPFIRGSNQRLPDEGPEHTVTLGPYYMDRYEVTNAQYQKFVKATERSLPIHWQNGTYPKGKADHPVTFVSWYDATAYCQWAGKRLPTDQEWEKAARGPNGWIFPWGNEFDKRKANVPATGIGDTTPVGRFESGKSYYGLYDMSGNVWEWTSSWYKPYPGNKHPTENYGEKYRVLKGGSWFDCSFYKCGISAPSFNRGFFIPETKNFSFGFRCAKDP
ncbi:MAG: formylglycine-generating enzyme family protein [Nitrospirae bacterium]|nr:formylglycine-generating enzyme family protein [Nitrospirota bacterium]